MNEQSKAPPASLLRFAEFAPQRVQLGQLRVDEDQLMGILRRVGEPVDVAEEVAGAIGDPSPVVVNSEAPAIDSIPIGRPRAMRTSRIRRSSTLSLSLSIPSRSEASVTCRASTLAFS